MADERAKWVNKINKGEIAKVTLGLPIQKTAHGQYDFLSTTIEV